MLTFFIFIFSFFFFFININISQLVYSECKVSPFECGFDSVGLIQISFSIQFFCILLIFVIFDMELVIFVSFIVLDVSFLLLFFFLFFFVFFTYYIEVYFEKLVWFY